jgi:hypothetical protein
MFYVERVRPANNDAKMASLFGRKLVNATSDERLKREAIYSLEHIVE